MIEFEFHTAFVVIRTKFWEKLLRYATCLALTIQLSWNVLVLVRLLYCIFVHVVKSVILPKEDWIKLSNMEANCGINDDYYSDFWL